MNETSNRAAMPIGTHAVLDRRTLYHANRNLLDLIKPGDTVLDVGCGSGSITIGIAEQVGPEGKVIGIDTSLHLIEQARENFKGYKNLHFELADINTYQPDFQFDLISSARVLQWLNNPAQVIRKMNALLKNDGLLSILDYNHEKIRFEPSIPESMSNFYHAFLNWRADAGMDNKIADHLEDLFQQAGFQDITTTDLTEKTSTGTAHFAGDINIWTIVAETRGLQVVRDGFLTEPERQQAITSYKKWQEEEALAMDMYLLAVTGRK